MQYVIYQLRILTNLHILVTYIKHIEQNEAMYNDMKAKLHLLIYPPVKTYISKEMMSNTSVVPFKLTYNLTSTKQTNYLILSDEIDILIYRYKNLHSKLKRKGNYYKCYFDGVYSTAAYIIIEEVMDKIRTLDKDKQNEIIDKEFSNLLGLLDIFNIHLFYSDFKTLKESNERCNIYCFRVPLNFIKCENSPTLDIYEIAKALNPLLSSTIYRATY